jgi:hypothetical protein
MNQAGRSPCGSKAQQQLGLCKLHRAHAPRLLHWHDHYSEGLAMTTEVRQRLRHLCVLGCLLGSATGVSAQVVVFSENFDTAVPTAIAPGVALRAGVQGYAGLGPAGNQFGGSFLRSPTGNTVTLTLSGLPAHSSISIEFLFAAIDSLDGTGTFFLRGTSSTSRSTEFRSSVSPSRTRRRSRSRATSRLRASNWRGVSTLGSPGRAAITQTARTTWPWSRAFTCSRTPAPARCSRS